MIAADHTAIVPQYQTEVFSELSSILEYWMTHTVDHRDGGFFGQVDNDNRANPLAPKGIVLNSRILWTFSAAYNIDKKQEYLDMATRAYRYIVDHFIDRKHGGVYWSVDHQGAMLNGRKQIYGLAFCIYGLTEYFRATGEDMALHLSKSIFDHIEKYSFDSKEGGYFEAFTQGWKEADDLRLSEKDNNEKKTANTHLHVIEAYTNLYSVAPNEALRDGIKHLLDLFDQHFIDRETYHLRLFMDESWRTKSSLISYGHDIEAAWLLLDCANKIDNAGYINRYRELSVKIADAAADGLDHDGGLWYECDLATGEWTREKHSWPQAEAMVGFLNAWQLTGHEKYLHYSSSVWEFVKDHIRDNDKGEWFWGVNADYSIMQKDKAGFWKCPYHNARACIELMKRLNTQNL